MLLWKNIPVWVGWSEQRFRQGVEDPSFIKMNRAKIDRSDVLDKLEKFKIRQNLTRDELRDELVALIELVLSDDRVIQKMDNYIAMVESDRAAKVLEPQNYIGAIGVIANREIKRYFESKNMTPPMYTKWYILSSVGAWILGRPNPVDDEEVREELLDEIKFTRYECEQKHPAIPTE